MAARVCTVFVLITVSVSGVVRAQSMNWPQPMVRQHPQYLPPVSSAPAPVFANPGQQPYFVANYAGAYAAQPASAPVTGQIPVSGAEAMAYQDAPVPAQPAWSGAMPTQPWCDPAASGVAGYSTDNCRGGSYGNGYGAPCYGGNGYGNPYYGGGGYACRPPVQWFGSAGVLMLDRDDENHRFFSYDSNDESYQLLDSQDTNFEWSGGVEAHVGRMDMCSCCGWEAVYWGIYPDSNYAYAYPSQVTGDLNGIFNFDQLDYNGQTADNYVNDAAVHRLWRETEVHNVEFNYVWDLSARCGASCCVSGCGPGCDACCANSCGGSACGGGRGLCSFRPLVGFRYLRLVDNLEFASDPSDTMFTGEVDELYYNIDTDNDLFGVQIGGTGARALGSSAWSVTFGAKAGVFVNDADAHSTIGGAAGLATINNGPNNGVPWDIEAHDDVMATIGELQAGIACAVSPTWRIRGDYRVIGISGVALPTNQIYQDLRGVQDVELLSTNGDLILHGVFVGAERTY